MTEPTPEPKVAPVEAPAPAQLELQPEAPKVDAPVEPAPVEPAPVSEPVDKPAPKPTATPEEIEAKLRAEFEAKIAEAAEKARAEERERLAAEQAEAAAKAEMSEVERAEAQRIEAQRLADEATKRAEASDKEKATLERQLEFQRTLASTGHALARNQAGDIDPALERLAFEEVERTRGTGDMATALRDLAAVKPWMFHQGEKAPAPSSGGPSTPPARRIDPATPPQTTKVFEQTPEEYAKTRRKLGIVQ